MHSILRTSREIREDSESKIGKWKGKKSMGEEGRTEMRKSIDRGYDLDEEN